MSTRKKSSLAGSSGGEDRSGRRRATEGSPARPASLRERAKQQTRAALIEAAIGCFGESGLDAPSLDAICERAGCTRGAFYVHFRDRDDLIAAAMTQRRRHVLNELLDAGRGNLTTVDLLRAFATAVAQGWFPVPGAIRSGELVAACRRSTKIRDAQLRLMAETLEQLERRVSDDQCAGVVRSDIDASSLALLLLISESGTELLLDLGFSVDVERGSRAFTRMLAPPG